MQRKEQEIQKLREAIWDDEARVTVPFRTCSNDPVIDQILCTYQEAGQHQGIWMDLQLYLPEEMMEWQQEWSRIIELLMQNAMDTCCQSTSHTRKGGGSKRWIRLVGQVYVSMLVVKLEYSLPVSERLLSQKTVPEQIREKQTTDENKWKHERKKKSDGDSSEMQLRTEYAAELINQMGGSLVHGKSRNKYVLSMGVMLRSAKNRAAKKTIPSE